jgi:hypothetical protein
MDLFDRMPFYLLTTRVSSWLSIRVATLRRLPFHPHAISVVFIFQIFGLPRTSFRGGWRQTGDESTRSVACRPAAIRQKHKSSSGRWRMRRSDPLDQSRATFPRFVFSSLEFLSFCIFSAKHLTAFAFTRFISVICRFWPWTMPFFRLVFTTHLFYSSVCACLVD